jgi:hypothetical protein
VKIDVPLSLASLVENKKYENEKCAGYFNGFNAFHMRKQSCQAAEAGI